MKKTSKLTLAAILVLANPIPGQEFAYRYPEIAYRPPPSISNAQYPTLDKVESWRFKLIYEVPDNQLEKVLKEINEKGFGSIIDQSGKEIWPKAFIHYTDYTGKEKVGYFNLNKKSSGNNQ